MLALLSTGCRCAELGGSRQPALGRGPASLVRQLHSPPGRQGAAPATQRHTAGVCDTLSGASCVACPAVFSFCTRGVPAPSKTLTPATAQPRRRHNSGSAPWLLLLGSSPCAQSRSQPVTWACTCPPRGQPPTLSSAASCAPFPPPPLFLRVLAFLIQHLVARTLRLARCMWRWWTPPSSAALGIIDW
jgi:hypothetical protein